MQNVQLTERMHKVCCWLGWVGLGSVCCPGIEHSGISISTEPMIRSDASVGVAQQCSSHHDVDSWVWLVVAISQLAFLLRGS